MKVVTFGEIMGRLATPGFQRFQQAMPGKLEVVFAGAEASMAASIAYLGGVGAFVTALPLNPLGDACVASLRAQGVETRHIVRTTEGRMGLYFLERGANQRSSQVLYDRDGASVAVTPADRYDWDSIFCGADWLVMSGITPALSENAAEVAGIALEQASSRGVRVAIDANYRSKLWRWEPGTPPRSLATRVLRELLPMVDLFVGGKSDGIELWGLSPDWDEEAMAREIAKTSPKIRRVAMSLREGQSASATAYGGMLYDASEDRAYYAPEKGRLHDIGHIVDRLGTGDAFTAALIFALETPELSDPASAIAFAAAAGCLAHSVEGDFNACSRAEIEAVMRGQSGGRVSR
jgi:2-dehydro-3-deoxygluconokinase